MAEAVEVEVEAVAVEAPARRREKMAEKENIANPGALRLGAF